MDRNHIRKEILSLVDSDPFNDVDLKDIIEKNTIGLSLSEAQSVRNAIEGICNTLKTAEEIDFNPGRPGITATAGGVFNTSSFKVRSTHQRIEKNEAKEAAKNSLVMRDNFGVISQDSDFRGAEVSPIVNPMIPANTQAEVMIKKKSNWLKQTWLLISENKLIATVLSTLILALIFYLLFGVKPGSK